MTTAFENLLEVKELKTHFFTDEGVVKAVDGVDFSVSIKETIGLVGESGCGKSITALSVLGLIDKPGRITGGKIIYKGEDLLLKSPEELRLIRGNEISMIFQEPMTSLNPVFTIGSQISESIRLHQKLSKSDSWTKVIELLKLVGIPSAEKRSQQYPYELSGGMRQRVMIAMALACNPRLLIADEPTTALDVTIQAQILKLLKQLQEDFGTSIILITHDLGVVWETCDRVAVMYGGKVVEYTDVRSLFSTPKHPYTIGLLNSSPRMDKDQKELTAIKGSVPNPFSFPPGCAFEPRCPQAFAKCRTGTPVLINLGGEHQVRCFQYDSEAR